MHRKLSEANLRQLAEAIEAGLSCREIALRLGVSAATAIRWTKRCGLTSRRSRRLKPELRGALVQALREGAAPAEAAARFGISARTAVRLAGPEPQNRAAASRRARVLASLREGRSARDAAAEA